MFEDQSEGRRGVDKLECRLDIIWSNDPKKVQPGVCSVCRLGSPLNRGGLHNSNKDIEIRVGA